MQTLPDYEIAEKYLSWGNKIVVIKHGKRGSVAYIADRHVYKVDSYHVKLLKSFGGGDAYAGTFVNLKHATAHATMVVTSHSCSEAMQTLEQIDAFINEHAAEQVMDIGYQVMRRESLIDENPLCLQVPRAKKVLIKATVAGEILIQKTINDRDFAPVFYRPEDVQCDIFGAGF